MLEQAVGRVEGVDAVVLVVVGGHIARPVAAHAGPEQPVDERVADGQVLHRHLVGGHADPVGPQELAVDHHPVPVAAADGHRRHGDLDLLAVDARADQDQVARLGGRDGLLDGPVVLGHPAGDPAGPLHRDQGRCGHLLARVVADVADDHGGGHALAAVRGGVEAAVEAVHARLVEHDRGGVVGGDRRRRPPGPVDGHGVVRRPALLGNRTVAPAGTRVTSRAKKLSYMGTLTVPRGASPPEHPASSAPASASTTSRRPRRTPGMAPPPHRAGTAVSCRRPARSGQRPSAPRYAAGVVKRAKTSIRLADGRELIYFDEREGIDRRDPDTRDLGAASTSSQIRCDPLRTSG